MDEEDRQQLEEFRAECDKVGVPYDAAGLVRHHRGNAGMTMETWKMAAKGWEARCNKADDLLDDAMSIIGLLDNTDLIQRYEAYNARYRRQQ